MYHCNSIKTSRFLACSLVALTVASTCNMPALANASRLTRSSHSTQFGFVTSGFSLPPGKKQLKKTPTEVEIYEFDSSPLDNRKPFLLVHGLRGEFWPSFRWEKVAQRLNSDAKFHQKYKIYLARYSTLISFRSVIPDFRNALSRLYSATNDQPITIMALSMGGNLVYESMLDEETDSKVRSVITLGTPFRGSPLFSKDWLQYSLYKRLCMPITRVDHSLALRFYFNRNKHLLTDLCWDNADAAIPDVGPFKSKLLFGPKGDLTAEKTANTKLFELNENNANVKRKFITYGGYMENPYLESRSVRYLENTLLYPVTFWWVKFPAHLAREHAVLNLLNHDIACVTVNDSWKSRIAANPFLYALNDGITPLSSALFLPESALESVPLITTQSVAKLKNKIDVNFARVFRGADHLTYIDGARHLRTSTKLRDDLNPNQPERDIMSWMLGDILSLDNQKLADDSEKSKEASGETTKGDTACGDTNGATSRDDTANGATINSATNGATASNGSEDRSNKDGKLDSDSVKPPQANDKDLGAPMNGTSNDSDQTDSSGETKTETDSPTPQNIDAPKKDSKQIAPDLSSTAPPRRPLAVEVGREATSSSKQ